MSLSKSEIEYRDNQRARLSMRALVAILAGIFLTWKWLLIAIAIFSLLGESMTMYKVFSYSPLTGKKRDLISEQKGELAGQVFVAAFVAMLSTMALAAIIKLIKDSIQTYLF